MPNFLNALRNALPDRQFYSDVGRGLLDTTNRGVIGGLLGAPVDITTMLLRPLGYNVEKPVGGSEWIGDKMQAAGMVSPQRNALAETLSAFVDPATAAAAPAKALAALKGNALASGLMGMAPIGATVWHGSPHKFDKFDASKIGTGEGAQAYGHGIYTASSPEVAKSYQVGLSPGGKEVLIDGAAPKFDMSGPGGLPGTPEGKINNLAIMALQRHKDLDKAISSESDAAVKAMLEKMRGRIGYNDPGNLYKVDLPDEHIAKMLDWDKPLSQQSPEVKKVFSGLFDETDMAMKAKDAFQVMRRWQLPGTEKAATGEEGISQYLRSQGIPGIRYLDGGSRGAGQGTSNYVVFPGNEGLLNILERNGKPIK